MPRKASGEMYVWDNTKEKRFLEKLDDFLTCNGGGQPSKQILNLWADQFNAEFGGVPAHGDTLSQKKEKMKKIYRGWKVLQSQTGLGYDKETDRVICSDEVWRSFIKVSSLSFVFHVDSIRMVYDQVANPVVVFYLQVNKECTHLRHEGLRNKELYFNVFEKNHAAGFFGYGSVTMGGGSTPSTDFEEAMDNSGTHPVLEEDLNPTNEDRHIPCARRPEEPGPSRTRGSAGKRKQKDATDEMTFSAMQEIVNHFRGRSLSGTSSDQSPNNDCIVDCMNIMRAMCIPLCHRTTMWHYFDKHPRLQRPFCQINDDERKAIIDSVVNPPPPPDI